MLDDGGILVGVLTRRDILTSGLPPTSRNRRYRAPSAEVRLRRLHGSASEPNHLVNQQHRPAARDLLANSRIGWAGKSLTRSDVLSGYRRKIRESSMDEPTRLSSLKGAIARRKQRKA